MNKNKPTKGPTGVSVSGPPSRPNEPRTGGSAKAGLKGSLLPLFPSKPPRNSQDRIQGNPVELISNLFRMSLRQAKPIYRYGVNVDLEKTETEAKEDEKPKASDTPIKLSSELRRAVIEKALKDWITKEKPKDYDSSLKFSYLFDSNGSTIYTLFSIFGSHPVSSNESREFRVGHQLERIFDEKLVMHLQYYRVKVHKGEKLDIQALFNYCKKQGSPDITLIQEQIRALNVIIRGQIVTIPSNVITPFNVFPFKPANQFKVSAGVIANKGYSLSVRPTEEGVVLNVANTVASFYEEIDLVRFLQDRFSVRDLNRPLHPDVIVDLKKEIFNKQIEAHHINYGTKQKPHFRRYRVNDIAGSSLDKFTLVDKNNKTTSQISIKDYFEDKYKIKLKYPSLPCIVDRGRKIPIEVCHLIEKQRVNRKMNPEETAEIIKKSAVKPEFHFQTIKQNVTEVQRISQPLKEFGLDFDPRPIEVLGRELSPILLLGGGNKEIRPQNGQYDTRTVNFFRPAIVKKWVLAFITDKMVINDKVRDNGSLGGQRFSELYCRGGREKGVNVPPALNVQLEINGNQPDANLKQELTRFIKYLNDKDIDHCIIILPGRCPDWVYRYIQYLEATVGAKEKTKWARTSCIKYQNYVQKIIRDKFDGRMFISNLWLKYNTKFGGINFALKDMKDPKLYNFLQEGYIFISVDVCHPAPGDKLSQSVAAVVGMWDLTNSNMSYCTALRAQKKMREDHSTIEDVGEIGKMVEEVLESYRVKKKTFPTKVVILRDGVSEGQFKIVLEGELNRVKQVLNNKYKNVKQAVPPLTCLVVQKRHKVRFMRKHAFRTQRGDDFNIQPGTVVDTVVVHPTDFSFYLAPHKAIQGTSRAAHIYIICDEIKFTQDQAQFMIHALSYLSPRCTKSTSIPTPVNLADLAAEQAKNIVISWNDDNSKTKMDEETRLSKLNHLLSNLADPNYKNTLYYI